MKTYSFKRYRDIALALLCIGILIYFSACGNSAGQMAGDATAPAMTQATMTGQNGSYAIVSQKRGTAPAGGKGATATATGAANGAATAPATGGSPQPGATPYNPGNPPGPVTQGNGAIPSAFPSYFSFGAMNNPGGTTLLDQMRTQNGASFAFRYQYLTGGVNTNRGWEHWNSPAGQYVTYYMQESMQHGYIPAFAYYELCLSNGANPGTSCGANNLKQDTSNVNNASTMNAYFGNWLLLMQKIAAFGKPALVIVEPDLWGFLQNATNGSDNAANVPASVASSGFADAAGFPNTVQGFTWALLHIRDKYAPNAILALHCSTWASGADIATDTRASLDVNGMVQRESAFLNSAGISGNPSGVSSWDLISSDVADFDSAQPGGRSWWDRYNQTFPNFARYLNFIGGISQATHRRVVMWQVPEGNQYFDSMNNTQGHYQDNRAEYILGNVSSFAAAGVIAVLFGPGNGGTMNVDAMKDGVTNPSPVSSYECSYCNTHTSLYADDDGGYLRLFVGLYMKNPVPIS